MMHILLLLAQKRRAHRVEGIRRQLVVPSHVLADVREGIHQTMSAGQCAIAHIQHVHDDPAINVRLDILAFTVRGGLEHGVLHGSMPEYAQNVAPEKPTAHTNIRSRRSYFPFTRPKSVKFLTFRAFARRMRYGMSKLEMLYLQRSAVR